MLIEGLFEPTPAGRIWGSIDGGTPVVHPRAATSQREAGFGEVFSVGLCP